MRHAVALCISVRAVNRILHKDLKNMIQAEMQEINKIPGLLQNIMNNSHVRLQDSGDVW